MSSTAEFYLILIQVVNFVNKSLISDKSATTQNVAFLSYWYRKKHLQAHF
jgi:hypothetical protein